VLRLEGAQPEAGRTQVDEDRSGAPPQGRSGQHSPAHHSGGPEEGLRPPLPGDWKQASFAAALALYARNGFGECEAFADYIADGFSVFMCMDL
jgi:hypothetical protein